MEANVAVLFAGAPPTLNREPGSSYDSWVIAVSGADTEGISQVS
ncbi:hypothetical protein GCM10025867_19780 [Frondihabitans sucicola]|uniref:Uncharacterized protein n=1 Tax=Frondihabitans sucicola TaxID=1268041 RepID=A0ABM8GMU5_9MICO|nr:hypothetical protein [Frondihabitans sucicola]BDZ49737.1 hypothetical protein GCM10025867_19780 [Frondihabitans sucicola]